MTAIRDDHSIAAETAAHASECILAELQRDCEGAASGARPLFERLGVWDRPTSTVMRVRCTSGADSTTYFIRIFKLRPDGPDRLTLESRIVREFETTLRLRERLPAAHGLTTVRPVACFRDHLAIVTEETSGQTLAELLESSAGWYPSESTLARLEKTLERVGAWVRAFQATSEIGTFPLDALREYVDVRLRKLVGARRASFTDEDRIAVLRYFDRTAADVPAGDLVETIVHGDLAPANIVIDGATIAVLDFAMCGRGSQYHDISRVFAQLGLLSMKPTFRPSVVGRLQRAALAGFGSNARENAPLFSLLVLMHRTNHFATLALRPASRAARVYNWHVRRRHRRWLDRLVSPSAALPSWVRS